METILSIDNPNSKKQKKRANPTMKMVKSHWQLYLIILLPVLYILIFNYIPMYGALIAFKDYRVSLGIMGSPWVGLKYFKQFFSSPSSWLIIKNTLLISVYSIVAGFPIPILLAIAITEAKNKVFKNTVQMVTYAPYFISTVVMVGMIFQVFDPQVGIVSKLLGQSSSSINYLGDAKYFIHLFVWSGIWQGTGYASIIYIAALSGVDPSLQEAALIDGASKLKRIIHVDLPSIMPTIIILLILSVGGVMSVGFEKVFLMQNPMNASSSEIIATYVYKVGLLSGNFPFSTAVGLFNSAVNLVLLISVNSVAKKMGGTSLW